MLLNDVMDLTVKSLETKEPIIFNLLEVSYLRILKRIIASGREVGLDFQNITGFEANGHDLKKNKGVIELLQVFANDPEKSLISLRNELGLSGENFFFFKETKKIKKESQSKN